MDQASSSTGDCNMKCSICNEDTEERLVKIGLKGKDTLKSASVERRDKKFATLDLSKDLHIHASCRSRYTHVKNIESAKRQAESSPNISPTKRKLRRSDSSLDNIETFNWQENCCLCNEEANVENHQKVALERRKKICFVQSKDFVLTLLKMLICFADDLHREIYKRLSSANDLVSLYARYHKDCYTKLYNEYKEKLKTPKTTYAEKVDQAMEDIYDFLLSSDQCQFTMTQLIEAVENSDVIPHEDTIKKRLINRFSDQIIISSRMGGTIYVCFSNNLYDIMTDAWYNNRKKKLKTKKID